MRRPAPLLEALGTRVSLLCHLHCFLGGPSILARSSLSLTLLLPSSKGPGDKTREFRTPSPSETRAFVTPARSLVPHSILFTGSKDKDVDIRGPVRGL